MIEPPANTLAATLHAITADSIEKPAPNYFEANLLSFLFSAAKASEYGVELITAPLTGAGRTWLQNCGFTITTTPSGTTRIEW